MKEIYKAVKDNQLLLSKLWKCNRCYCLTSIANSIISSFIIIIEVLFPKYLLESLFMLNMTNILKVLSLYAIIYCVLYYLQYKIEYYQQYTKELIFMESTNEFILKGLSRKLSDFEDSKSFDKYTYAFSKCCTSMQDALDIISSLFKDIIILTFLSMYLFKKVKDIIIFPFILICTIVNLLCTKYIKRVEYEMSLTYNNSSRKINYIYRLFYLPNYVKEMLSDCSSQFFIDKKNEVSINLIQNIKEKSNIFYKNIFKLNIIKIFEILLVSFYFARKVVNKNLLVADFFTSINAYNRIKDSINNTFGIYNSIISNSLSGKHYINFIHNYKTKNKKNNIVLKDNSIEKLDFINVSFKYPNSDEFALKNINFSIKKGEKVALVGDNGSGKSTINKLILNFYEVTSGKICINDININEYDEVSLRNNIKIMFQDFNIYSFSIKDNITLGKSYKEKDLWQSVYMSNLDIDLNNLNYGIDTILTNEFEKNGIELSGGQYQKIALSRFYLNKSNFGILDEPTSNLDINSQDKLYNIIFKHDPNKTYLLITHDMNIAKKMDRIIILKNGHCVECDSRLP